MAAPFSSGSPWRSSVRTRTLRNIVGIKPIGIATNNNSALGRTWCAKYAAPGDFDAVRLVIYHGAAVSNTVYTAIIAATDEERADTINRATRPIVAGTEYNTLDPAAEQYGWRSVTWAAASSVTPAAGTATAPTASFSDWIPCSSIPRRDGARFPLILARVNVQGNVSSWLNQLTTAGTGMETATTQNGGFIVQARWEADASGLMVSAPAANHLTGAAASNAMTIGFQFRTRKKGITIVGIGDSLVQNALLAISEDGIASVGMRAAAAISALGVPCGYVNHGLASQAMEVFQPIGLTALTNWSANAALIESFSPNQNGGVYSSEAVARFELQRQRALVEQLISKCDDLNAMPFVTTGIPCAAGTIGTAAIDAWRLSHNTMMRAKTDDTMVLDWDALLTDGASPARIQVALQNDTTHYNATGLQLLANQLTAKIRQAFGI